MVYAWQRDLLCVPREQLLLHLYNAIIDSTEGIHIDKRPTIEDAKRAITRASNTSNGKVIEFMGEEINVDFSNKKFDFTEFKKQYGPFVLREAITNSQISGMEMNSYLNNLEREAAMFNIQGKYIKYFNAKDPIYNGIYFVCGYDIDTITDKYLDIEKIVKTQSDGNRTRLDIHAEKLTGGSPYSVHQNVVHYCLGASTIRTLGNKYGIKSRINICSNAFINNIVMLCRNINNIKLPATSRMDNQIALNNFFPAQAEEELETKGEGLENEYIMHTNPERLPFFKKNMVSLDEIIKRTFDLKSAKIVKPKNKYKNTNFIPIKKLIFKTSNLLAVSIPNSSAHRLQEILLNECPEIYFSQATSPDTTTFIYDAVYQTKLQHAYILAVKPQLFNREFQFDDLTNQYNEICTRGIHLNDIDKLFTEADKAGLKMCVNMDRYHYAHSCNAEDFSKANFIYPISFPNSQADKIQSITDKLGIQVVCEPKMNKEKVHGLMAVYANIESIKETKKWLSQHPEILYYQSKPVAAMLTGLAAETGFGSPEKNRFSSICLVFDSYYQNEIKHMLFRTRNPEFFKYSLSDIRAIGAEDVKQGKARGLGTSSFGCPNSDIDRLFDNTQYYNIPICISDEKLFYNMYDARSGMSDCSYTITFPSSYIEEMNSLLDQFSIIDMKDRLVSLNDFKKYNYNRKSESKKN